MCFVCLFSVHVFAVCFLGVSYSLLDLETFPWSEVYVCGMMGVVCGGMVRWHNVYGGGGGMVRRHNVYGGGGGGMLCGGQSGSDGGGCIFSVDQSRAFLFREFHFCFHIDTASNGSIGHITLYNR